MTKRQLPEGRTFARPKNYQWDVPSDLLARWAERPLLAAADDANTVSIFDVIGEDPWSGAGFTAKRMAGALRSIGPQPVTVQINSPGGDMFEGIAIYNLLREHPAKVTVDVMGLAASAGSIVAMAGDSVRMGLGSFLMVHNAWGLVIGNRHELEQAAQLLAQFDAAIADIYQGKSGADRAEVERLMDAESFLGPSQAVDLGLADEIAAELKPEPAAANNQSQAVAARRRIDAILANAGLPRAERRRLVRDSAGTPGAAGTVMPGADHNALTAAELVCVGEMKTLLNY